MKITTINIPADETVGLQDIKMSKLSNLVLVAGKNGSGKSRLLTKIKTTLQGKPNNLQIANAPQEISNLESAIKHAESTGKNKQHISAWSENLQNHKNILEWNFLQTNEELEEGQYTCFDFVPKQLNLQDPHNLSKLQITQFAEQILINTTISDIQNQTFSAIQNMQEKWFNATHQNSTISKERTQEIFDS